MKVGTLEIEIRNRKFEVEVTDKGQFCAEVGEKRFSNETLEGLRGAMMAHTKRVTTKVSVPATILTSGGSYGSPLVAKAITLTGIHAKDGDILFRYDDSGKADRQSAGGMHNAFIQPLTTEQRAEYDKLSKAKHEATKAVEEFMTRHKFHAMREVETAIAKATDDASA